MAIRRQEGEVQHYQTSSGEARNPYTETRQICAFKLEDKLEQSIEMPALTDILSVGTREGNVYIWAKVYPEFSKGPRHFRLVTTGYTIKDDSNLQFIGTVFNGGELELHVFEVLK